MRGVHPITQADPQRRCAPAVKRCGFAPFCTCRLERNAAGVRLIQSLKRMETLRISTDHSELDVSLIHRFLSEESSWAKGIPLSTVKVSIENSLCFGGFVGGRQVAFARVISDFATFANLVDVFVLLEHRGRGYGKEVVSAVLAHEKLQGLRRFTLATGNAHGLYAAHGFTAPLRPNTLMERYFPDLYLNAG
jgi:GNAT superfamily N-acetyltransferase